MAVRTTVDIPEPLHEALRNQAEQTGLSMRSLIVRAIQEAYVPADKGEPLSGPPVKGKGKLGSLAEASANVNDFLFP